jgi:cation transport ATPase
MFNIAIAGGSKIQTIKIKTRIACDHCKMCGSCGARIEKALYSQKGVKRVDVDDKKMEIVVVYNTEKITTNKIKETITSNGYDADDQKATPESYARLDECCKGES